MSVLAADELPPAFEGVVKPGFWHRLARALDASFANRSKRASRSRHCGGRGATLNAAAGFCAEMCACRSGLIPRL